MEPEQGRSGGRAQLSALLDAVPRLSRENAHRGRRACKICNGPADLFDVVDFNKVCSESDYYAFGLSGIPVCYLRCSECGFLFTDFFDAWEPRDFARWIYNADYPLVDSEYQEIRPVRFAREIAGRLQGLESIAILDYGSGAGIFSEQMRLLGFAQTVDFDPFSSPERPATSFDLLTCFEVLEHSPDPLATLRDMCALLRPGGCILFSQSLQPANIEVIRANWWYAAPRNGHVSLYTHEALARLAQYSSMVFCGGDGLFLFRTAPGTQVTERLFGEFRPAFIAQRLTAPDSRHSHADDGYGAGQWHGLEATDTAAFRWSAQRTITWRLAPAPCYPCRLLIRVPLLMCAYPAILEGATFRAGGLSSVASVSGNYIHGIVEINDASISEIHLCTGEPRSPAMMRGEPDQRPLGVAITASGVGP